METKSLTGDPITKTRINALHPRIRVDVSLAITEAESSLPKNCLIRIVQGLRTIEEQDALYAQGRTKPGKIVTNAKGGSSFHNYGLAVDFALLYDKDGNGTFETLEWTVNNEWLIVVQVFKKHGFEWGGDFRSIKDYPHFQKVFGYTWQPLYQKWKQKQFIADTQYVIL